jgi:mRNA-degrading endonuclease RelE of RelBE toxin-antitoxin system
MGDLDRLKKQEADQIQELIQATEQHRATEQEEERPKKKKSKKSKSDLDMRVIMQRFDHLDAKAFTLRNVAKEYKKLPKKTKAKINRAAQKLSRGNPNILERTVYWVEDATGGYLPAVGKAAGYGFMAYKAGELVYNQGKKFLDWIK